MSEGCDFCEFFPIPGFEFESLDLGQVVLELFQQVEYPDDFLYSDNGWIFLLVIIFFKRQVSRQLVIILRISLYYPMINVRYVFLQFFISH